MVRVIMNVERVVWKLLKGFSSFMLVVLLVLLFLQIVGRYLRIQSIIPHDEVITLITVWFVFFSSALLLRDQEHIRVQLLESLAARSMVIRKIISLTVELLILLFAVFYFRSAITVAGFSAMKTSQVLRWSEVVWYSSLVVSASLMVLYSILRIVSFLTVETPQTPREEG